MKNTFTLSALLITSLMQAGETPISSCLEATKECAATKGLYSVCGGLVVGAIGLLAKTDRGLQADEEPYYGGDPIAHNIKEDLEEEENMCAEYAPAAGACLVALPFACYGGASLSLRLYKCLYPNSTQKED